MSTLFTKELILYAFGEIAAELRTYGVHGEIFLVGSSAVTMGYNPYRASDDVDARIDKSRAYVLQAAKNLARREGWDRFWLSELAVIFIPATADPDAIVVYDEPGLTVKAPSPEMLLAMKGLSARKKDEEDLTVLIPLTDISNMSELIELVKECYSDTHYKRHGKEQQDTIKNAFRRAGLFP